MALGTPVVLTVELLFAVVVVEALVVVGLLEDSPTLVVIAVTVVVMGAVDTLELGVVVVIDAIDMLELGVVDVIDAVDMLEEDVVVALAAASEAE